MSTHIIAIVATIRGYQGYDFNWNYKSQDSDGFWGHDLFYREPPKVCARCKSRSWKDDLPRRKMKMRPVFREEDWIEEDKIDSRPWITSVARLRALNRQGKLTPENIMQS